MHILQKYSIIGEIGKILQRINATLEDTQEHHQSTIKDIEGIISN